MVRGRPPSAPPAPHYLLPPQSPVEPHLVGPRCSEPTQPTCGPVAASRAIRTHQRGTELSHDACAQRPFTTSRRTHLEATRACPGPQLRREQHAAPWCSRHAHVHRPANHTTVHLCLQHLRCAEWVEGAHGMADGVEKLRATLHDAGAPLHAEVGALLAALQVPDNVQRKAAEERLKVRRACAGVASTETASRTGRTTRPLRACVARGLRRRQAELRRNAVTALVRRSCCPRTRG